MFPTPGSQLLCIRMLQKTCLVITCQWCEEAVGAMNGRFHLTPIRPFFFFLLILPDVFYWTLFVSVKCIIPLMEYKPPWGLNFFCSNFLFIFCNRLSCLQLHWGYLIASTEVSDIFYSIMSQDIFLERISSSFFLSSEHTAKTHRNRFHGML